ncbi:MAG: YciI family protein [Amylibacter sp.]
MMYMALIYAQDGYHENYDGDLMADYGVFTQEAIAAGVFKAGDALHPVPTASSVKMRDGKVQITAGPFAETKEQLGGYYLLDCSDLDEALHWAGKIPTAKHGTIEVRPVMVFDT